MFASPTLLTRAGPRGSEYDRHRMGAWAISGVGFSMFVTGCLLGQELWKINKTLERIAHSIDVIEEARAEGGADDD